VSVTDGGDELAGLMTAYQGGDMHAFEELYARLAPQLRGYLTSLARDAVRAQDLLQDTFLQVHKARHTYESPRPVRPWIYAIARNVFLMSYRTASRRAKREVLADEDLPELPVPPEVASLADRQEVSRALATVPVGRREAVVLHHVMGLSFKEVGRALGISEGAAKVRAHRGMVELRELLGATGGDT